MQEIEEILIKVKQTSFVASSYINKNKALIDAKKQLCTITGKGLELKSDEYNYEYYMIVNDKYYPCTIVDPNTISLTGFSGDSNLDPGYDYDVVAIRKWNLNSLKEFVISFETNSVLANEIQSKRYGNIIKNLVKDIMSYDTQLLDEEQASEVADSILLDSALYTKFNKLHVLIMKKER